MITIGPLSIPVPALLLIAAVALAVVAGNRAARKSGHPAGMENAVYGVLLVGLVVARLVFVLQHGDAYLQSPWSMIDIRDGGWSASAGWLAAGLAAVVWAVRHPSRRKGAAWALGSAGAVWLAGALIAGVPGAGGPPLPDFDTVSVQGEARNLADYGGQPVVVNLWASWCPPCRREMPVFQRAQDDHDGIHFVFLNQGETAPVIANYLAHNDLALHHVLLDPQGRVAREFDHRALPATLFFNSRGELVDTRLGELSDATLAQRLRALD